MKTAWRHVIVGGDFSEADLWSVFSITKTRRCTMFRKAKLKADLQTETEVVAAHTRIGALLQAIGATVIILLLSVSASSTEVSVLLKLSDIFLLLW